MTEATGIEAKTIRRLSEVDPKSRGFTRNADNPLDCDLLVVDEASMVDVVLMQALMKATADDAALLTVGDIDQLPSVGPGQVFAEIIGSGLVPVVRVTQVLRRAAVSRPNRNPQPGPKFDYKLAWVQRLEKHARQLLQAGIPAVLYRAADTDVGGSGRRLCAKQRPVGRAASPSFLRR